MVDLLGERLDQVERGDEEERPGQGEEDRGLAEAGDRDAARGDRDQDDAADPHHRPAQEALPVAAPDRVLEAGPPPRRSQGLRRGCSEASWRRRRITVRRSWTEAEKRISATSSARRRAASSPSPPIPSRPAASAARVSSAPSAASQALGAVLERQRRQVAEHRRRRAVPAQRQVERRPGDEDDADRPGDPDPQPPARGAAAPRRGRRPGPARRRRPARRSTRAREPGKRRKTKLPITAPVAAPAITAIRSCESAAGRSAVRRETGASSV